MTVTITDPSIRRDILIQVGDPSTKTPRELDEIARDHGLTLRELAQVVDESNRLAASAQTTVATKRTPTTGIPANAPTRAGRPAAVGKKVCTRCRTTKPLEEYFPNKDAKDGRASWCRKCNNTRPRTPARMVEGRARGRAYRALAKAHAEEFEQLFAAETAKAIAEHERVTAAAEARGQADAPVARIKPGPKRREQTDTLDRLDVARCPACHEHHDAGHVCTNCETATDTRQQAAS